MDKSQKKLGLVLGGGGAKGYAHIGVLKVLQNAGLTIDFICGCSMGALIGGLYASGIQVDELESIACKLSNMREILKLIDRTPSRKGLMVGKKVRSYLSQFIAPDERLENTKIPLIVNAVDLITGKEIELNNGNLLDCLMASSAVPGFFPPVEMGSYRLIDGGALDDVPVRLLKDKPVDFILAIDVHLNDHNPINPEDSPRGHHLPVPLPEFVSDFYRSAMIMTSALTQINLSLDPPDMLIRPRIPKDVTLFGGFQKANEVIRVGEEAMLEALPELQKKLLD